MRFPLLLGLLAASAPAAAEPVSLDAWFQGPRLEDVTLSGDGRFLAMIVKDGEHSYVAVKDRTSKEPSRPVIVTDPTQEIHPRDCGWSGPTRLVCRLTGYTSKHGNGKFVSRLMAVDSDGANSRLLLNDEPSDMMKTEQYQYGTFADRLRVLDWNAGDGESMLVSGYLPRSTGMSVGRVNTRTGSLKIIARPQDPLQFFSSDERGNVLFAAGVPATLSTDKKVHYFGRADNDAEWTPLKRLLPHADSPFRLEGVIPGEKSAHVVFNHDGRLALYRVDLTDQKDPELIYWHEQRDLGHGIFDGAGRLLGVSIQSNWLPPQYIDTRMQALDNALRKNWPNRWNWVKSSSDDGKLLVVRTGSLSEPPGYHLLDTSGSGVKFDAIGYEWPGFARRKLPVSAPAPVKSKDGRALEVLFTPAESTSGKAPLVVITDGTQGTGGFEPATYFLATRGYAVLRVYFSGTRIEAGYPYPSFYDWNGRAFEEVRAAMAWAAQRDDVDASRTCIVGRNGYGGYTALLAAARADTPFKCAASFQGVSNLFNERKEALKAELFANQKPTGVSEEQLQREAPTRRAAEFRIPVLLVESDTSTHSARDSDDGREMAAALAAANKPHQLVKIKDFDEAYLRAEYAALEKFLAAHLR